MMLRGQCTAPKYVKILELSCEVARPVWVKALSILYMEARRAEGRT